MKPPMRQEVTVYIPAGEKDDYGRPIKVTQTSKARVQYSTRVIKGQNGQTFESSLEVDLPSEVPVGYGTEISYQDWTEKITKGQVIAMSESTNLAGNKVFFRTVFVG